MNLLKKLWYRMTSREVIDIGRCFHPRLIHRNSWEPYNAVMFRYQFLRELDCPEAWLPGGKVVCLDFSGVKRISPSFATKAFAYFLKYADAGTIRKHIRIINCSPVIRDIIDLELEDENSC